jgi:hypothetical protein
MKALKIPCKANGIAGGIPISELAYPMRSAAQQKLFVRDSKNYI